MLINRIEGAQVVAGQEQGYMGLPIRFGTLTMQINAYTTQDQPMMETSWSPTPEELAQLNAGGSVILCVLGEQHPPVMLYVNPVVPNTRTLVASVKAEGGDWTLMSDSSDPIRLYSNGDLEDDYVHSYTGNLIREVLSTSQIESTVRSASINDLHKRRTL